MKKFVAILSVLSLALLASCGTETDMSGETGTDGEDIIIDMEENNTTEEEMMEEDNTSNDPMMEDDSTSADDSMEDDSNVDGEAELDIVM